MRKYESLITRKANQFSQKLEIQIFFLFLALKREKAILFGKKL